MDVKEKLFNLNTDLAFYHAIETMLDCELNWKLSLFGLPLETLMHQRVKAKVQCHKSLLDASKIDA